MRYLRILFFASLVFWPLFLLSGEDKTGAGTVVLLKISGPIGPATSDYVRRGLKQARKQQAHIVILQIDTPGGFYTSTRDINKDILDSPVPVVVFVAPRGAWAASAGTYILYASHVAAMAPGTNVGAATPVKIGRRDDDKKRVATHRDVLVPRVQDAQERLSIRTVAKTKDADKNSKPGVDSKKKSKQKAPKGKSAMERKMINDATAYIRSLAQLRGRNVKWAIKAVREAASLTAGEAVRLNVADLMAEDIPDLLKKLDGRRVKMNGKRITLKTRQLLVKEIKPDWQNEFLSIITNPTLVPILMMLGVFGLFYELMNPGYVLPGVIGAICLILGLYATQVLPINYAGLGLILLGLIFMVAEAFVPSIGALGIGGAIAFIVGSIMLVDTEIEGLTVYKPMIVAFGVSGALAFGGVAFVAIKARKRKVVSGSEEMLGSIGRALESFTGRGRVYIHSEEWQASSQTPIKKNQQVRVVSMDGLLLAVEPINQEEL